MNLSTGIGKRAIALVLLLAATSLTSCASGWRGCRDWTNLAKRDAGSGNIGDVIPGIIYLAVSPIACVGALALSPITELTDRPDESDQKIVTPTPSSDEEPSATPTPPAE